MEDPTAKWSFWRKLLNPSLRLGYASQQILARDPLLSHRTSFRFVDNPSFLSPSRARLNMQVLRRHKLTDIAVIYLYTIFRDWYGG
jgi:hypothetical protein